MALLIVNLGERFRNVLDLDEVVQPFVWHSFCISINIDLKQVTVIHNGNIQAVQEFDEPKLQTEEKLRFMTFGKLLGAEFVGALTDVEVFGKPLPDEELIKWTLCQNQVKLPSQSKGYDYMITCEFFYSNYY